MRPIITVFAIGVLSVCSPSFANDATGTRTSEGGAQSKEQGPEAASTGDVVVLKPFVVDLSKFPDRTREYWQEQIQSVHLGMSKAEVFAILRPVPLHMFTTLTGGANCCAYAVDSSWTVVMCFDHHGSEMENRLIQLPDLRPGGWKDVKEKKAAEPGATDNPDDAQ